MSQGTEGAWKFARVVPIQGPSLYSWEIVSGVSGKSFGSFEYEQEAIWICDRMNADYESPVKEAVKKAVENFRERVCQAMFGQCESDNVAQRTAEAIRALPLESEGPK